MPGSASLADFQERTFGPPRLGEVPDFDAREAFDLDADHTPWWDTHAALNYYLPTPGSRAAYREHLEGRPPPMPDLVLSTRRGARLLDEVEEPFRTPVRELTFGERYADSYERTFGATPGETVDGIGSWLADAPGDLAHGVGDVAGQVGRGFLGGLGIDTDTLLIGGGLLAVLVFAR